MTHKRDELYACEMEAGKTPCLIESVTDCSGDCEIVCCGKPMTKVVYKTADQGKEKHVPVVEKVDGGYKVKVGDVPHPMLPEHFIQFIELRADGEVQRKYLKPGAAPEAVFMTAAANVTAVEFCNLHGVWGA